MTIKAIVEMHARRGKRAELLKALENFHEHRKDVPGFVGYELYEMMDDPDKLIEIVEWETREARQAWLEHATASGVLSHVVGMLRKSFDAVTVRRLE
jgi:heme-degrading monooxygenase HmoA